VDHWGHSGSPIIVIHCTLIQCSPPVPFYKSYSFCKTKASVKIAMFLFNPKLITFFMHLDICYEFLIVSDLHGSLLLFKMQVLGIKKQKRLTTSKALLRNLQKKVMWQNDGFFRILWHHNVGLSSEGDYISNDPL